MFDWVLNLSLHMGLVKNRTKSVENKAMPKSMSMSNDWVTKPQKRNRQIFMSIRTIFWPYDVFGSSVTLNIIKTLREPFEREVGEFEYGSPAVVHS